MQPYQPPPQRPRYTALVVSIVTHAVFFTAMGLVWRPPTKGLQTEPDRPVGIALVNVIEPRHVAQPKPLPPDQPRFDDPAVPDELDPSTVPPDGTPQATETGNNAGTGQGTSSGGLLGGAAPPMDLGSVLAETLKSPDPTQPGGLTPNVFGAESAGVPGQASQIMPGLGDGGSKIEVKLFNVPAYGHRFLFVFDRSDSMNDFGGRPLAAAKRELLRCVKTLTEKQEFQIIFYNDRPYPLRAPGQVVQLLHGDKTTHRTVDLAVNYVMGSGGTNHMDALKMALRMRPDVVYFLTDARLPRMSRYQLNEISARAKANETTIHCIEFGTDSSTPNDSFLAELAEMNGGQYQYFNIATLDW